MYEGQHIYLQKFLFTSVEILVTFEWTFSQLSHYGRTWVEMNKNTRKIGAWLQPNSPSPWQWHNTGQHGDKMFFFIIDNCDNSGNKMISGPYISWVSWVNWATLTFPSPSLASTLCVKNQVGLPLQVTPGWHLLLLGSAVHVIFLLLRLLFKEIGLVSESLRDKPVGLGGQKWLIEYDQQLGQSP